MDQEQELSPKQSQFLAALLQHPTAQAAAVAVGCSPRTAKNWVAQPAFRARLALAERELIDGAVRRLSQDLADNHAALRGIRDDENQPAGARVRAALGLDAAALRWRESLALEQRLGELEAAIARVEALNAEAR